MKKAFKPLIIAAAAALCFAGSIFVHGYEVLYLIMGVALSCVTASIVIKGAKENGSESKGQIGEISPQVENPIQDNA